jgi:fructokinase
MELAHSAGAMVSLDLNFAFGVFSRREDLLTGVREILPRIDVLKATEQEAEILFGRHEPHELARRFHELGVGLVALTFGERGARLSTFGGRAAFAVPPSVTVRDTTGAGDAFLGTLLSELVRGGAHRDDLAGLAASDLQNLVSLATWAGAQAVTALGATTAMVRAERASLAPEISRGTP